MKKSIEKVDVAGKRVLIRVDFNVPLDGGAVADDTRLKAAIPTIKSVIDRGGRAILISHLGRPEGAGYEEKYSLAPCAEALSKLLGTSVGFPSTDCTDGAAKNAVEGLKDGGVVLLENLRFHKGEKAGDADFGAKLAAYGDIYVNDAFGTCHRSDASMVATPEAMEGKPRVVGFLVEKEIAYLTKAIAEPKSPFVVVLGGAKVSDKLPAIDNLLPKADELLIGGAMAYTFLKALKKRVGKSLVEENRVADAHRILEQAAKVKAQLHVPTDHVCAADASGSGGMKIMDDNIDDGHVGLDIGPKTQANYARIIRGAKTVVWNGPMGVFEKSLFRAGTEAIARAMKDATESGATTIVGGGDSAAAVEMLGIADKVSHVSTGGGASLAMLEGKKFPSVELLDDA
jgi:phosphoglycerate kinase